MHSVHLCISLTQSGGEAASLEALCLRRSISWSIRGVGIESWGQRRSIAEPEPTKATKHNRWECVANDPLKDSTQYSCETSHEVVNTAEPFLLVVDMNILMEKTTHFKATPLPDAPRHPMRLQASGVIDTTKQRRVLSR